MEMQQSNHRHKPDWSNLPTEILQLIDQFLFKGQDLMNFRYVCKNWFHSTLISSFLPRTAISDVPKKVISSSILLLRPLYSPQLPPLMALAVEPFKGVIKLFNPFTRIPLSNLPENLDLACFSSTRLSKSYHILDEDDYEPDIISARFIKVLVCYRWSIRHCSMLALSDGGRLHELKPFKMYKPDAKCSVPNADDIVTFNGREHSLDEDGFLWLSKEWSYLGLYIVDCTFCGKVRRRKRLAVIESSPSERLLMIVPVNGKGLCLQFKVYELTDKGCSYVWSEVTSFGDADLVLFVSRTSCFFVAASEFSGCQLKNCIVFSDDAFPQYPKSKYKLGWNYESKVGDNIAIYSVGGQGSSRSIPVECYPGFPAMLWSPPPWILHNALSSPLQSQFQCELEDVEMIQQSNSHKEVSQLEASESKRKEQTTDIISTNSAGAQTTSPAVVNDMEHVAEEVLETNNLGDTAMQTNQIHDIEHLVQETSVNKVVKKVVTVKFQGLDVESDYLPILQKVWMKYGDILEGSLIRSFDTKTMALTSLAKMLLILKTNSGTSLTDDQAHYLDSTLSDLQCMRLKVDWLASFVENALSMHQSKPLQASLVELEKAKSKVEEMEQKFLSEMAEMKRELDKDIKVVSESLPMNLDKILGEGLY